MPTAFRDMFNLPNKKGMEVILHFLFSQLNSHLAYEEFRDCWPVYDKKQEQLFRKKCTSWLATISKVGVCTACLLFAMFSGGCLTKL